MHPSLKKLALLASLSSALLACGPMGPEWLRAEVPVTTRLNSIHGVSANHIFAVGDDGVVLHFDGNAWTKVDVGLPTSLYGVFMASPTDIWVVGESGTVLRFDGTRFVKSEVLNTSDKLERVWGTGPNDVWIASSSRTWRWNGTQANAILKGTSTYFSADSLSGSASAGLWMLADDTLYLASGGVPYPMDVGTSGNWEVVVASSPADVWLVDGLYSDPKVVHFNGATWATVEFPKAGTSLDLRVGYSPQPGQAWFAGGYGNILHAEGTVVTHEATGGYGGPRINGVWGASATDMWVVGNDGWVLRRLAP